MSGGDRRLPLVLPRHVDLRNSPCATFIGFLSVLALAILSAPPDQAGVDVHKATLLEASEADGGDPAGHGLATLSIDSAANTVSWSFQVQNITLPLTAAQIHRGVAGLNGPFIVDFSKQLSGSGLLDVDLAEINPGNASGCYLNLHNADFEGGAIRGQLVPTPEPGTCALMLAGLAVLGVSARRHRQRG